MGILPAIHLIEDLFSEYTKNSKLQRIKKMNNPIKKKKPATDLNSEFWKEEIKMTNKYL